MLQILKTSLWILGISFVLVAVGFGLMLSRERTDRLNKFIYTPVINVRNITENVFKEKMKLPPKMFIEIDGAYKIFKYILEDVKTQECMILAQPRLWEYEPFMERFEFKTIYVNDKLIDPKNHPQDFHCRDRERNTVMYVVK